MAKSSTSTSPRIAEIAAKIRGACLSIVEPQERMLEHSDAVKAISQELTTTRLDVALNIAEMSSVDKWLPGEIEAAVKHAAKMANNVSKGDDPDDDADRTVKTLTTLMSEMRVVASPRVRDSFPTILSACEDAWAAEQEALDMAEDRSEVKTPVRKFASRKYNLVITISRAVKDGKVQINNVDDLVAYAIDNDPDHDEDKIEQRLHNAAKMLNQIFTDFGHDDIKTCVEYLETITAKDLLKARRELIGDEPVTPVVKGASATGTNTSDPVADHAQHGNPTDNNDVRPEPAPAPTVTQKIDSLLNDEPEETMKRYMKDTPAEPGDVGEVGAPATGVFDLTSELAA